MKIRFIINPISGTRKKQINVIRLIKLHLIYQYDICYTKKRGDATLLCKNAIEENINTIIAVGGDGTVNECIKVLINTEIALGVIPCGSGNGFATHIGMSQNLKSAIKQLNSCQIKSCDTCSINNHPFVNVAGIGFDAHIANLFSNNRTRGLKTYIKLIFKELSYNAKNYTIKYDNKEEKVKAYFIAFANTSLYGNNIHISPNANINDGLMDLVIVKQFPKWRILLFLFKMITKRIQNSKYVKIIKTKEVRILAKDIITHIDGEPIKIKGEIHVITNTNNLKLFKPNA